MTKNNSISVEGSRSSDRAMVENLFEVNKKVEDAAYEYFQSKRHLMDFDEYSSSEEYLDDEEVEENIIKEVGYVNDEVKNKFIEIFNKYFEDDQSFYSEFKEDINSRAKEMIETYAYDIFDEYQEIIYENIENNTNDFELSIANSYRLKQRDIVEELEAEAEGCDWGCFNFSYEDIVEEIFTNVFESYLCKKIKEYFSEDSYIYLNAYGDVNFIFNKKIA